MSDMKVNVKQKEKDINVYLLLFTCSLTRSVHLEILPNQTTQGAIQLLCSQIKGGGGVGGGGGPSKCEYMRTGGRGVTSIRTFAYKVF